MFGGISHKKGVSALPSAIDVAKYFLVRADADSDPISLLKLQKLLYYAQGFWLALKQGQPLFDEPVLAWEHGPVVRSVWDEYREYRGGVVIDPPSDFDAAQLLDHETTELLEDVWTVYGQFSAWKLRDMTHNEPPWNSVALNEEIPRKVMTEYFATLVEQ